MTQIQLAAALSINIDTLRDWEQGRRHPGHANRAKLRELARTTLR